jgi:hypothetical protein
MKASAFLEVPNAAAERPSLSGGWTTFYDVAAGAGAGAVFCVFFLFCLSFVFFVCF